ncbi:hypothetical protein [Aridibaculum aurantiacum]|uniref:hypothetical protein n=1 Tax=Aridibaculum aurantiacum TaxID=2810307 RepID=UPI001A96028C|nr:hypothetical protein [Aridibaculum aurantiacum]
MRNLLFILSLFSVVQAKAQGDIVVFKKNQRTLKTFFKGSVATFITSSGEYVATQITNIKSDSIFFRELVVRQVPTQLGVTRMDTVATVLRSIHFKEIAGIPKPRKFNTLSVGNLLVLGGGGFLAVNLVNSLYINYSPFAQDNLRNILPAAGALAAGITINKLRKDFYMVGKKYSTHYIPLGTP